MDNDEIKKALDDFENDNFMDSKDKLKGEISKTRDKYVKDKTGLKNDINPKDDSDDSGDPDKSGEE
jgi:hypothetical protein